MALGESEWRDSIELGGLVGPRWLRHQGIALEEALSILFVRKRLVNQTVMRNRLCLQDEAASIEPRSKRPTESRRLFPRCWLFAGGPLG